jgi:hypothetical protein
MRALLALALLAAKRAAGSAVTGRCGSPGDGKPVPVPT